MAIIIYLGFFVFEQGFVRRLISLSCCSLFLSFDFGVVCRQYWFDLASLGYSFWQVHYLLSFIARLSLVIRVGFSYWLGSKGV